MQADYIKQGQRGTRRLRRPAFCNRMSTNLMLRSCASILFASFFLAVFSATLEAQSNTDYALRRFRLDKVTFTGSKRFQQADLLRAAGLKVGEEVTTQTLNDASQRLGMSGAFANVQYQFFGVPNGIQAVFKLDDQAEWAPATFENIVWFDETQLVAELRRRVPLFDGGLPKVGDLPDQLRFALEELLRAKGLTATVDVSYASGAVYRASGVYVGLERVTLSGNPGIAAAEVEKALQPLLASPYGATFTHAFTENTLRALFEQNGYLQVHFAKPGVQLLADGPQARVALTIPVEPGRQYRFLGAAFTGNTVVTEQELARMIKMETGGVADLVRLRTELLEAHKLYGARGYMGMKIETVPLLAEDGSARFELRVTEGDVYRMGKLTIVGLDEASRQQLRARFALREGDTYDSTYPHRFMQTEGKRVAPNGFVLEYTNRETLDDMKKVVDVTLDIRYRPS